MMKENYKEINFRKKWKLGRSCRNSKLSLEGQKSDQDEKVKRDGIRIRLPASSKTVASDATSNEELLLQYLDGAIGLQNTTALVALDNSLRDIIVK